PLTQKQPLRKATCMTRNGTDPETSAVVESTMPLTASMRPGGRGSAARCETLRVNLSPTDPPTTSALAVTVRNCVAAFAVPWIPPPSILIFASLRVTPCVADGAFLSTTWFSSASVKTNETGVALLSRANVLTESARPSTGPDAKTRPGAVAAHTLVTTVDGSKAESVRGGPDFSVIPDRTIWPATSGPSMICLATEEVPTNPSMVNAEVFMAPGDVRNTPHRPAAGSRTMTLSPLTTQPKISALAPAVPHDRPVGATTREPSPGA